jgi:hypothetical protein
MAAVLGLQAPEAGKKNIDFIAVAPKKRKNANRDSKNT